MKRRFLALLLTTNITNSLSACDSTENSNNDRRRMSMSKQKILVLNIVCPIIIGAFIYYLISPDVFFVKKIDAIIGGVIKIHIPPINNIFFKLIRNYFLDMLWGYALVFTLFYIIGNNAIKIRKILGTAFIFSAAMEIIQITPFIQGTFDVFDIGVEFLAETIAAFIIYKIYFKEDFQNEKEN